MQSNQITVQALAELLHSKKEVFLLDVRNLDEYQIFNLGGTLIPLAELPQRVSEIPSDKLIVAICHSGYRSQVAVEFLQSNGINNARNLIGGVVAWQQAGLEIKA